MKLRYLTFQAGMSATLLAAPPNIVTIVMDDVGWGDFCHASATSLPSIERLAAEGTIVDRFYVNPICSPTRASLMTGKFAASTGVNNRNGLDQAERTLANDLRDAGYSTWMCGKWHLGGDPRNARTGRDYHPDRRGFEHFFGLLGGAVDYHTQVDRATGERDWWRDGEPSSETGYTTDLLADEAARMIHGREAGSPYYLHLAFNAAHGPMQPPNGTNRGETAHTGVMHAMDAAIGRLMDTVRSDRDAANTLVVLFGDNGAQQGRGGSNGELRGWKGEVWEGGVRNRAIFWWPGRIPSGRTSKQWMWVGDLRPTLCEVAGVKVAPGLNGVPLLAALESGEVRERPPFCVGHAQHAWIEPPWKLVSDADGPHLFNLESDPRETTDLSEREPERLGSMLAALKSIPGTSRTGRERGPGKERTPR